MCNCTVSSPTLDVRSKHTSLIQGSLLEVQLHTKFGNVAVEFGSRLRGHPRNHAIRRNDMSSSNGEEHPFLDDLADDAELRGTVLRPSGFGS